MNENNEGDGKIESTNLEYGQWQKKITQRRAPKLAGKTMHNAQILKVKERHAR
jgi:hypothetical protein